jgi:hypothetical protein
MHIHSYSRIPSSPYSRVPAACSILGKKPQITELLV